MNLRQRWVRHVRAKSGKQLLGPEAINLIDVAIIVTSIDDDTVTLRIQPDANRYRDVTLCAGEHTTLALRGYRFDD